MKKLILATLFATLVISGAASASSAPQALTCSTQAQKVGAMIFKLNGGSLAEAHAVADLVDRVDSESGTVLTWEILFKDTNGNEVAAPYLLKMIEEGCFLYSFSIPSAG
jgi:hypothetical protein